MGSSISSTWCGWFHFSGWSHYHNVHFVYQDMEQRQIRKLRLNRGISKCSDGVNVRIDLLHSNEDLLHSYVYYRSNDASL